MTDTRKPKHIRQLTELVAKGVGYKQIGARMGMTKSQVIGKAHRLGLGHPNSPAPALRPSPMPTAFPPFGHCLWGLGNPGDSGFRFCGEPTSEIGGAWCPEHRKRVYVRASP